MKSNLNDTSPKRPFEILKGLIKKGLYIPNILITVHFYSYSNKRPFEPPRSVTKQTLSCDPNREHTTISFILRMRHVAEGTII